ncbi:MAG: quinone oxidoreductase [Anaerolineae bacterium]|nr:quinone oxidoreductase [Anaerolineae bacterium]
MKAVRFHEYGEVDVLRYEDIPVPEPGAGQVRVKVAASGVNFIDTYQRRGRYPVPLPSIPGNEGSGVVDAIGEGAADFQPGDRVAWAMVNGSYADYALVPQDKLVPVPANVRLNEAAAVILQGMTAHYLTIDTFPLKVGDLTLIHAAAGGTGQLLVQMAKRRGAKVIATVSSEEKAAIAASCGADEIIRYTEQDFEAEVRALTGGRGVDVVYDSVGATTFEKSLKCLRPRGMLVLFGAASGPVPPFDLQRLNGLGSLYVTRPSLGFYVLTRDDLLARARDVFRWLEQGSLRVAIDRTFPLCEAAAAHVALEGRESKGKYLLIP